MRPQAPRGPVDDVVQIGIGGFEVFAVSGAALRAASCTTEGVRGTAIGIDHLERTAHVGVVASIEHRCPLVRLLPGVLAVAALVREFLQEGRAFHREHRAGGEIAEAQMAPAEHHEQQSDDVQHGQRVDDAEDIAREQRADARHQALGREHAQADHALAGRAAGHERLEHQVVQEVDHRRRDQADEEPRDSRSLGTMKSMSPRMAHAATSR